MGWTSKPDTSQQEALARTEKDIALEQAQAAREERTYQREQEAAWRPMFQELINSQITSQSTADARSNDQWARYMSAFAPAEDKLAQTAMEYDTPGRREQAAREAVGAVDAQFERVREAQMRDLTRTGASLASDPVRALTLDAGGRFAQAKASVAADRTARQQVENTGLSLVDNVAKLGRGLAGTSLQAQGLGLNAGSSAGSMIGQQQSVHNAGLAPVQSFYGGATGALGTASNIYGNIAQQQAQANQGLAGIGSLAGTLLTAGKGSVIGSVLGLSDPKTKKRHGKVNDKAALEKVDAKPVEKWTYKQGMGDGGTHIGRMADDDDVSTPQGKAIDLVSELGLHQAAIRQLSKDVKGLKKVIQRSGS